MLLDLQVADFELPAAAQCAVSGASGVGKTTFMNLLAGLLPVQHGQLAIAGEELSGVGEAARDRIRGRHIGLVFQRFHLLTGFSALENVVIAQNCAGAHDPEFASELLDRLGLASHRDQPPHRCRRGSNSAWRWRVRWPIVPASCWPTSPRETSIRSPRPGAVQTLREVCRQQHAALLIITHDPAIAGAFDRPFPPGVHDGVARLAPWNQPTHDDLESA